MMSLIDQALQKAYQQRLRPVTPGTPASGHVDSARGANGNVSPAGRELYVHAAEPMRGRHFRVSSQASSPAVPEIGENDSRPFELQREHAVEAGAATGNAVVANVVAEVSSLLLMDCVGHPTWGPGGHVSEVVTDSEIGRCDSGTLVRELEWMPFPSSGMQSSKPEATAAAAKDLPQPVALSEFKPTWEVDSFKFSPAVVQAEERLLTRLREALQEVVATRTQVVWVSSLAEGEGRTTIAALLALSLARMGQQVLLLQGDGHAASLAKQLGVACDLGWSGPCAEAGLGRLQDQCLFSLNDRLALLPAAEASPATALAGMLTKLIQAFNIVVVDAAVGMSHRNLAVPTAKEMEVVVQDVRRTSSEDLQRALWAQPMARYREVRVVQNFV